MGSCRSATMVVTWDGRPRIRYCSPFKVHFLSTLAWAEVHAVIARIERERALAKVLAAAAREALEAIYSG